MATHTSSPRTCVARKKRLPIKVGEGLGFPVVALASAGHMPAKGEDQQEAARVFYVAAKRATRRLVIGVSGEAEFGSDYRSASASNWGLAAMLVLEKDRKKMTQE